MARRETSRFVWLIQIIRFVKNECCWLITVGFGWFKSNHSNPYPTVTLIVIMPIAYYCPVLVDKLLIETNKSWHITCFFFSFMYNFSFFPKTILSLHTSTCRLHPLSSLSSPTLILPLQKHNPFLPWNPLIMRPLFQQNKRITTFSSTLLKAL